MASAKKTSSTNRQPRGPQAYGMSTGSKTSRVDVRVTPGRAPGSTNVTGRTSAGIKTSDNVARMGATVKKAINSKASGAKDKKFKLDKYEKTSGGTKLVQQMKSVPKTSTKKK
jgi:hypothetical protein